MTDEDLIVGLRILGPDENIARLAADRLEALAAENRKLSYDMIGIMHFVDKWLEGDELKKDEINRAVTMREKTLEIVEDLQEQIDKKDKEIERLKETLDYAGTIKAECERLGARVVGMEQDRNELLAYRALGAVEELSELVRARDAGRLVVLPCNKNDKLFVLTCASITGMEETKCKRIVVAKRKDGPCAKVIAPCVNDDWGGAYRELYPDDFGKTVFLTRAEAEAALGGGGA